MNIILADALIDDVALLLSSLPAATTCYLLHAQDDAVKVIQTAFQQPNTHLHFLGHGEEGAITLGGKTFTADDFIALAPTHSSSGAIHFWSCKTGAGTKGVAFVNSIAQAFNTVVSACSTLVGAAHKGGSWRLDVHSNERVAVACPFGKAAAYQHTLDASSLLRVNAVALDNGLKVEIWIAPNTAFSTASLRLSFDPSIIAPVWVNGKVVSTSGLTGWTWLSSPIGDTVLKMNGYTLTEVNRTTEVLLQSISFTFAADVQNCSISLGGTYLENEVTGKIALGTLPTLTYIAPALPVWDTFAPPEALSYTAGTTAALDFAVQATDANGDTITYKAVVGQMVESLFTPTTSLSTITLTSSNGHLTGSVVLPRTFSAGVYLFRLYADDKTTDANLGSVLDVPFSLLAAPNALPTGTVTISGTPTQNQTLTAANTLADLDGIGTIAYQWNADGTAITGAIGNSLMLTEAHVGKKITVTATYTDNRGTLESVVSTATSAVVNINDAPTGSVSISGTPTQGQTLTAANTLADLDGLGTIAYQWNADGTVITGAIGNSFTLTETHVGKKITVTATYTDGHGTTESVVSAATVAVANVNDVPTGTVTISGSATQNQMLIAANTLADLDGLGTIAYQWNADGTAITGAIGNSFTLTETHVGKKITVTATYTDNRGTLESVVSTATSDVVNINDAPTGSIYITGAATKGQILTVNTGTLSDADGLNGEFTYQWQANEIDITGATSSSYTLTNDDVGKNIRVVASYTDNHGTKESVVSTATVAVANVNDVPTGAVTISGTPTQNQTLTAANTLADLDGLGTIAYQWNADGTTITGAISNSLVLGETHVGKKITVTATYTDGHSTTESVVSAQTTSVANVNDAPTGTVTISGTPTQNQTLTAANTLADLDGIGTIAYQWNADGTAITGVIGENLTLTEALVGKKITVTATYTDGHGTTESVVSTATVAVANVNDAPTGTVTINGTPTQEQTLTAANTLADLDGLGTIAYQWNADGTAITGAIGNSFTLTEAHVSKKITVTAIYTDGHGTTESVVSAATTAVANVNDTPTGTVTITDSATQNQTLTAANTLADLDGLGTIDYQWNADGTAITGAIGNSLMLTETHVGKKITVTATYTDGHGTTESVVSAQTTSVANVNDAPTGTVTITGSATQGQTLTASNTLEDLDGMGSVAYQWQADGMAINGATGNSFTLTEAHVSKKITVTAIYTDGHGTTENVVSAATSAVVNINDTPTGTVTITGSATQNQTLTAANTLADLDGIGTIAYQWNANGVAITGAVGDNLTLTEAQVGKKITVVASYIDGHSTTENVVSAQTTSVANVNDTPTGTVTITGSATQGQTLTASNTLEDLDGMGSVAYQWNADGTAITGAIGNSLMLTETHVGKQITVTATYTDGHGTTENVVSAQTASVANVNDAPTGTVTISGTPTQGQTLTAANTLADADGLGTIAYQWNADGTAITGAIGNSLVLGETHVGKKITVTATYTDGHGTTESVVSAQTTSVANVNDTPTGTVTITGSATQGQTLTASNTLEDLDGMGSVAYQWNADGTAITGAIGNSLVLSETHVGKKITVVASYIDGHSTTESVVSAATDIISLDDTTPPYLISTTPINNSIGISTNSNITLTFSEAINKGNGTIALYLNSPTKTLVENYNVADNVNLSIEGNKLTINPTADLEQGKNYLLAIENGAITDSANNLFEITDVYNFTTETLPIERYSLSGNISFWKDKATPLQDVSIVATSAMQTPDLLEFRNIQLHSDGSRTVELWTTSPSNTLHAIQVELELQEGSTATWQNSTSIPSNWTTVTHVNNNGHFVLGSMGIEPIAMEAPTVKLGELTLSAPIDQERFEIAIVNGLTNEQAITPFALTSSEIISNKQGHYSFTHLMESLYYLEANKAADALADAVTIEDARAALMIAVGLNPNSDGTPLLPYQYLAADVNRDGKIRASDALTILKMAIGVDSVPEHAWIFASESIESAEMGRSAVDWSHTVPTVLLNQESNTIDFIGIVKGDVDGSALT
uniref:DUF4347 domain-containing protein n=1 Tax=Chlorobium chlorochromatii (strain CaD3) TaxID=340177 RepID=Q3AR79_CHLCH